MQNNNRFNSVYATSPERKTLAVSSKPQSIKSKMNIAIIGTSAAIGLETVKRGINRF